VTHPVNATRKRVGVFFGGVSPEHEVSVISAIQAMAALDERRWEAVPVYIGKDGAWWMGDALRDPDTFKRPMEHAKGVSRATVRPSAASGLVLGVPSGRTWFGGREKTVQLDIALPVLHGGAGENGSLQGLFETLGVPYGGSGPLAAALAMDKVAAKVWAASADIPQVEYVAFREVDWAGNEEAQLDRLEAAPGLPLIVKPAGLGSSIGIGRADTREELDAAIEEAFRYDDSILVERAVRDLRELNCSVLGEPGNAVASVLEEPLSGDELLSFQDKYMRGPGSGSAKGRPSPKQGQAGMASLDRRIPAEVPDSVTQMVRELALRVFESFGCSGLVRIDFLMDRADGSVYFNEINTMPGSLAFYLWEPSGIRFNELLDRILDLGFQRHRRNAGRVRSYDVNLLSEKDLGGLKGGKT
jgi:D-alanine-D-alanine ligase